MGVPQCAARSQVGGHRASCQFWATADNIGCEPPRMYLREASAFRLAAEPLGLGVSECSYAAQLPSGAAALVCVRSSSDCEF